MRHLKVAASRAAHVLQVCHCGPGDRTEVSEAGQVGTLLFGKRACPPAKGRSVSTL